MTAMDSHTPAQNGHYAPPAQNGHSYSSALSLNMPEAPPPAEKNGKKTESLDVIRAKLTAAQDERAALATALRSTEDKMAIQMKKKPATKFSSKKRTAEEVDIEIRRMEQQMEVSSIPLAQEKQLLRDIKQMKNEQREMSAWDEQMDGLRAIRNQQNDEFKRVLNSLDSLRKQIWHTEASEELHQPIEAITSDQMQLTQDMFEIVNGMYLKQLKLDHHVCLKLQRNQQEPGGRLQIAGLAGQVEAVKQAVGLIGPVSSHLLQVDNEAVSILVGKGGSRIKEFQENLEVLLDIDKKKGQLKILGQPESVKKAVKQITALWEDQRRVDDIMVIEPEQVGTLLGKAGSTIKRLSDETGASLDLKKDKGTLRVSGNAAQVKSAKAALNNLLMLNAESTQEIEVADEVVYVVIGKGGEMVRKLQDQHGCMIDFRREERLLKLRGTKVAVEAATKEINGLIEENKRIEVSVNVKPNDIGALLGEKGRTIRTIQDESGAVVEVAKDKSGVKVRGKKANVAKAKAAIESLFQYNAKCQETFKVEMQLMPFVIGKGGEQIRQIQNESGAVLDSDRGSNEIRIRGSANSVAAAKDAIELLMEANRYTQDAIFMPWDCTDILIGPCGMTLKKLEEESGAVISLPGTDLVGNGHVDCMPDSKLIMLKGRKKQVDAARRGIMNLTRMHRVHRVNLVEADVQLLGKMVINQSGILDTFEKEPWNMQVDFDVLEGEVKFRGEDSLLKDAAQLLEEMLDDNRIQEVEMEVEQSQIGLLIGKGGATINKLQADSPGCTLDFDKGSDILKVRGAKKHVREATKNIRIFLLENARVEVELEVPEEVHGVLIGKGGSTIKQLQTDTGTQLDFKKVQGVIKISGPRKGVEKAEEAVGELIKANKRHELEVEVHPDDLILFSARGGLRLRELEKESGASMLVDRNKAAVKVRGNEVQVKKGRAALEFFLEDNRHEEELPIADFQVGTLIGKGGATIRQLQDQTEALLDMDKVAGVLRVRGCKDSVDRAVARINDLLKGVVQIVSEEVMVDAVLFPYVIGKGGANIKRLQNDTNTTLEADRKMGRMVVKGAKDDVRRAKQMLQTFVDEMGQEHTVQVNTYQVGTIIGKGGQTIRQLQAETEAIIDVDKVEGMVRIRGSGGAVQKAKDRIAQLLKEEESNPLRARNPTNPWGNAQ